MILDDRTRLRAIMYAAALSVMGMDTHAQAPTPQQERCRTENQGQPASDLARGLAVSMQRRASSTSVQQAERDRLRRQARDRIFGSELMTPEERDHYLTQLRQTSAVEERVRFRIQHQQSLLARAAALDRTIPNPPGRSKILRQERDRQKELDQLVRTPAPASRTDE